MIYFKQFNPYIAFYLFKPSISTNTLFLSFSHLYNISKIHSVSTRLNYFPIFLYFPVARSNLSEYLCSQQVCSAIPRLRAWNSPSRRRYLASTCFPTTIYDVMKRIRSAFESFLPLAASSLTRVPPTPFVSLFFLLVLIWLFGQSLPVSSYLYHLFRPPFSPIDFPDFSRTKRTDPNFVIPRDFIYSSSSSASFEYDSLAFYNSCPGYVRTNRLASSYL